MDNVTRGTVLPFPLLPKMRIWAIIDRCPALGAVAARLPAEDDVLRGESERVLAQAFTLLLHLPDLTREEADRVLDHSAGIEEVAAEELSYLHHDPEKTERYDIWREVWAGEDDPRIRAFARYCIALIARLYRLECVAKVERNEEGALSARSA